VIEPRTPVVVGVGQVNQRAGRDAVRSPVQLFADAARLAGDEARGLLGSVDTVATVLIGSWRYPDPGAAVARELRIEPRSTVVSSIGGNSPQLLLNEMGSAILAGERDIVLVGGAEVLHGRRKARAAGAEVAFEHTDDPRCATVIGSDRAGTNHIENAHRASAPTQIYPLLETALRGRAGRTIADHQQHIGRLWSHFAAASAANPDAWSRVAYTPEEIITPTTDNRMINFPYTKRMNANVDVDQGAALIITSYERAHAAGIADDALVFLLAGADAHDHWFVSERAWLGESVGIGAVVHDALGAAGLGVDDVARFDLYSCFPSAVQLAMDSIGVVGPDRGDERPLTVTGGLCFAGGPLNNYPTHAVARMVELLRADPGSVGVTTGLGWYATKHSCGVWSTTPPRAGYVRVDPATTQRKVDSTPSRHCHATYSGSATVEATSVPIDREGTATAGVVVALTDAGDRVWANVLDRDAMQSMMTDAWENRRVTIRAASASGEPNLVEPNLGEPLA
jgi:acetyl-CoA C-acetyltransferase